eukprot:5616941-Pyramimonas_sp.AAC.1
MAGEQQCKYCGSRAGAMHGTWAHMGVMVQRTNMPDGPWWCNVGAAKSIAMVYQMPDGPWWCNVGAA